MPIHCIGENESTSLKLMIRVAHASVVIPKISNSSLSAVEFVELACYHSSIDGPVFIDFSSPVEFYENFSTRWSVRYSLQLTADYRIRMIRRDTGYRIHKRYRLQQARCTLHIDKQQHYTNQQRPTNDHTTLFQLHNTARDDVGQLRQQGQRASPQRRTWRDDISETEAEFGSGGSVTVGTLVPSSTWLA